MKEFVEVNKFAYGCVLWFTGCEHKRVLRDTEEEVVVVVEGDVVVVTGEVLLVVDLMVTDLLS